MALASSIKAVWEVKADLGNQGSPVLMHSHLEADVIDKKIVNISAVGAKVQISRLPFLTDPVITIALSDRSRGLIDHYVWWTSDPLLKPSVAAVVITELPLKVKLHDDVFKIVTLLQNDYAAALGMPLRFLEIDSPYGKALEMIIPQRQSSALFPTANYILGLDPSEGLTLGISRFALVGGLLVEWSIIVPLDSTPPSDIEQYAGEIMDEFWLNVGVSY